MKIKINGTDYELHFGWAFLRHANNHYGLEAEGVNTQTGGMVILMAGASMKDPDSFLKLVKCGLASEQSQPTNSELEGYVEKLIEDGKYQETFDQLIEEIKKRPILNQATAGSGVI